MKFELGQVAATPGAAKAIGIEQMMHAVFRHAKGDWGDVCREDKRENELSLRKGYRLVSSYKTREGVKFWIITEADRSSTTVLLPEEY